MVIDTLLLKKKSPYIPVLILIGGDIANNVPTERQVRVKHLELTLGYIENFFNNGTLTITFHILKVYEGLRGHAKEPKIRKFTLT